MRLQFLLQSHFIIQPGGGKVNDIIKRVKSGDVEAFSQLVSAHEQKAINFAYRMLKDRDEAEDAAQEAFLRAFDKINTFREDSSFTTWFFTILNNICLDMLRKRSKRADTVSIHQSDSNDDEYELQIEDTSAGPYENLQKKAAGIALEEALSLLSEEHRTIITLRDINDFEYDEISKILGISLGTVKSRLSRARLALRKVLEKNKELFL
jgi:RNA polymerase sigma-70 factor (ECF subfamily)